MYGYFVGEFNAVWISPAENKSATNMPKPSTPFKETQLSMLRDYHGRIVDLLSFEARTISVLLRMALRYGLNSMMQSESVCMTVWNQSILLII